MSDPFRLRVQKAICAALEEITPENEEYVNDFSGRAFRGRLLFGDTEEDGVPMLAILEPPLPSERRPSPVGSAADNGDWEIIIQGFVQDDRENPTDPAHVAMADVKKRLAKEQKRRQVMPARGRDPFGLNPQGNAINRIEDFKIGAGVVRPPEDAVSSKAYFWLTLTLKIVEDNSDPFG